MRDYECPKCKSQEYFIDNYYDDFNDEDGAQWWNCTCNKCNCKFSITKAYKLISINIEEMKLE